ncbi:unnamed protein product [Brassica oleracea]|uniref:GCK domain-containing protein n=4 Tax=Brassica TaxID=3705 RepID=A0ABQ7F4P3_BRACR|nr:hypothetical protein DY000_02045533 [Brassica cretica]VDD42640.1 unnamed protein product [Brassica oleracea]
MGITSSTEPNSRYHLFTLEKLHQLKEEKLEDMPEKKRVGIQAISEASQEVWWNGIHALFPTKGELSIDPPKEGGTEMDEDDQVFERFSDFMKEGGCKESFSALVDCLEDT